MRLAVKSIAAGILLFVASAWPASAADVTSKFFDTALLNAAGGNPCYARTYDDAHLKEHNMQTVRAIEIDMSKDNANDILNTPERFQLGFGLKVKKSDEWFTGVAICQASDTAADCFIEGDGGRFLMTPTSDGGIRLETGNYGIALEGEKDFVSISGSNGDDRVFLLKPAPRAECDAASEHLGRPQP